MAVFDAHKNLAVSTVFTAPVTPTAGTSLVVAAGGGARFPAVPFNATICPAGSTPDPTNAEIVRVTAITTDTLTIVRAQEGTVARSVAVTDLIYNDVSVKVFTDIEIPLQALVVNPMTGWYDMQRQVAPVLPGNAAAVNITNNNAIMAAAPTGSTFYYAGGVYAWNAAWAMPAAKTFNFQGQGNGATGANTIFEWTSNVAGDVITLPNTFWYWTFNNLTFGTSVAQTAGALLNINGVAGVSITNCTVAAIFGGTWNDVFKGPSVGTRGNATTDQSWNSSLISNCQISGYKGIGVFIDSSLCSLVVSDNCVIQGQFGSSSGAFGGTTQALAGIQTSACGALQINDSDILGNMNNLLLSPVSGQVCASVFSTNTYYDNSGGSCIKIAGAGATVRARFDTCSFTTAGTNFTGGAGTGLSAFEIAGTFAFTATAGQGINLINCNILNTFATAGTTNAVLVTNGADFSIAYCNIAAYTNGLNVTPIATLNTTKFNFSNNTCGTAGGYNGVTTGVLVNGGSAYRGYTIVHNDFNGCTTPITDSGAVALAGGGQKLIQTNLGCADGVRAGVPVTSIGSITETVIAQIWCPANTIKAGTQFRGAFTVLPGATQTTVIGIRIGPNGTVAGDLSSVLVGPTVTNTTAVFANILTGVSAPGATALHVGAGSLVTAATIASATVVTATTFNCTVGNWVSLTYKSSIAIAGVIKSGLLEIIGPT